MYVCMNVSIYGVCMDACMYVRMHVCMYARIFACNIHTHTYIHGTTSSDLECFTGKASFPLRRVNANLFSQAMP